VEASEVAEVRVYIGLGSNLGDRMANLGRGVEAIGRSVRIEALSSVYETEPWGYEEQPKFLNAALVGRTGLSALRLLEALKAAETEVGRKAIFKWGPRVFDADLLFYGDEVIDLPELKVPHPRLHERAFVLAPLAEVAADLAHPVLGLTASQLLGRVEDKGGVKKVKPPEEWGVHVGRRDQE
jgi:2-amino-4-hydroxy-6-hydroxymethyldihydropteridine diphosphokinase